MFFGSAIDAAVTELLENKPDWRDTFSKKWYSTVQYGKFIQIADNDLITYSYADFDEDVLTEKDKLFLVDYAVKLGLNIESGNPVALYKEIVKIKKNPYVRTKPEELKYFGKASWISLLRKGEILLESFYTQFYPKIKKVHATQKQGYISDPATKDSIVGVIDMVLEIEGHDKPIIFDLKTASSPYSEEDIDFSEQLTLYAAMKSKEYDTDLVGYVVLCKNIQKKNVAQCTQCGFDKNGRHQTCNNLINGVRCGGEWLETKTLAPEVQVLVKQKDIHQIEGLLHDMGNVLHAMKQGIYYKNTEHCSNWYGGKCPYFNLCHKNSTNGLKQKE